MLYESCTFIEALIGVAELVTIGIWGYYVIHEETPDAAKIGLFFIMSFIILMGVRIFHRMVKASTALTFSHHRHTISFLAIIMTFCVGYIAMANSIWFSQKYEEINPILQKLLISWLAVLYLIILYLFIFAILCLKIHLRRRRAEGRIEILRRNPGDIPAMEASMRPISQQNRSQNLRNNELNQSLLKAEGLNNEELSKLGRRILTANHFKAKETTKNCLICIENFQVNDHVIDLPCFHFFHEYCATNWLKRSPTCPICRMAIRNHLGQAFMITFSAIILLNSCIFFKKTIH